MKIDLMNEKSLDELRNFLEKKKLEFEASYGWIDSLKLELGELLHILDSELEDYIGEIEFHETPDYKLPSLLEGRVGEFEIIVPGFFSKYLEYTDFKKDEFEHSLEDSLDYRIRIETGMVNNQTYLSLEMSPSSLELKDEADTLSLKDIMKVFESVKNISIRIEDLILKYVKLHSLDYKSVFDYKRSKKSDPSQLSIYSEISS